MKSVKPLIGRVSKIALLSCLLMSLATACKPRQSSSESKQIFTGDLPGSSASQRRWNVDPKEFPHIISMLGCTGFILDRDGGIAMSAHHCTIAVGQHFCHGTPGPLYVQDKKQMILNKQQCPTEMVITAIIEESRYGDMDYVIFKYDILDTQGKITKAGREKFENVRVLGSLKTLGDLYTSKRTINLTGYPGDEYAKGTLTDAWGLVRSEVRQSKYYRLNKDNWDKLQKSWAADPKRYKADPVRFEEMLKCIPWRTRFTTSDPWVFYFDVSVYGGNSGGPIYYFNDTTKEPIVIGFPSTYLRKPDPVVKVTATSNTTTKAVPKTKADCFDDFAPDFIEPILGKGYVAVYGTEGQPEWNEMDRARTPLEHLPAAIPMPIIVQKSKFFASRPDLVFNSNEEDLDSAIEKAADPEKVDALDNVIEDALK